AGKLGTKKAAKTGIALVGLRNCGHLGRVGDWAELAAEAGQASLHFLNTSGAQRVAPFGGSDRRLSTNPITIGVPVAGGGPIVVDMTASMAAQGAVAAEVARFAAWVKGSPPARPETPVLLPGDIERMTRAERSSGVPLDDKTCADLIDAAVSVGLTRERAQTMLG